MNKRSIISLAYIKECFDVDANGNIFWRSRPRSHFKSNRAHENCANNAGTVATSRHNRGYLVVSFRLDGRKFDLLAHHVVWILTHGCWPEGVIDHINRVRDDNRPANLRDVSPDENMRNNGNPRGTGLLGAYPSGKRFMSHVQSPRPYRYLGTFDTAQEAHQAYMAAIADK